jgi:hypothetical protein
MNKEASQREESEAMEDIDLSSSVNGDMNTMDGDGDDDTSTRISEAAAAMKFQPLQPIPEKSLSQKMHQSNSDTAVAQDQAAIQACPVLAVKESGSFMNNIQDPVAASKVFKKSQVENEDENSPSTQQMSHTPPTSVSTSYETMHFGKRPRSGVSSFAAECWIAIRGSIVQQNTNIHSFRLRFLLLLNLHHRVSQSVFWFQRN